MSSKSHEYIDYLLTISNAKNISTKITQCSNYMVNYDNCVSDGKEFEECYSLHYEKFLQCCKEIDMKDKNNNLN